MQQRHDADVEKVRIKSEVVNILPVAPKIEPTLQTGAINWLAQHLTV